MKDMLTTIGVLNEDQKLSITNVIVMVFVAITAFKALFGGMVIDLKYIDWKIEPLDMSATLPLLFSLLNYGHKRQSIIKPKQKQELSK